MRVATCAPSASAAWSIARHVEVAQHTCRRKAWADAQEGSQMKLLHRSHDIADVDHSWVEKLTRLTGNDISFDDERLRVSRQSGLHASLSPVVRDQNSQLGLMFHL